ncbi:tetratricopeptide repeat protein [Leptolyngbya sp. FACHB-8]|uniref:tetratricopeptide repeat protein n=1 Tax=unclassified Leptolyngbya TaxID=2650499 RepID=UPI0016860038|nr:tetratricopeptide repeat protein [Leptolyngbya sp. FACHB-8]MBD1912961.1 tetratricopeptide repeat protein [Leptolyngbya sp. FACHB-8]
MQPSPDLSAQDAANRAFTTHILWQEGYEGITDEDILIQCDRAIQLNPNDWLLWNIQAESFHRLGFYDAALHSYDQALKLNPKSASAWFFKACLLGEHYQQYSSSLKAFEESLRLEPDNWEAWHNYGNCLARLNCLDKAVEAFDRAIQLEPSADSWYRKAEILVQQRQLHLAIEAYNQAIALEPDCGEFWYQRGLALVDLQQYTEARQSYDRAVSLDSRYRYVFYNCYTCYANNYPS